MFRNRLGRIISLVMASLSFGGHLVANVSPALAEDRYEVAQSCFAGVDYSRISVSDLSVLVGRFVTSMRERGASDQQIVGLLGYQLAKDASGCSRQQLNGLMQNVSLILVDSGIQYSPQSLTSLLASNFAKRPGAVAGGDDDVALNRDRVY